MSIKKVIKQHGWTLERLAKEMNGGAGITQPSMSSLVNGNPSLDKLREIASIIGISVSELLSDDDSNIYTVCPHCGKPIAVIVK